MVIFGKQKFMDILGLGLAVAGGSAVDDLITDQTHPSPCC